MHRMSLIPTGACWAQSSQDACMIHFLTMMLGALGVTMVVMTRLVVMDTLSFSMIE